MNKGWVVGCAFNAKRLRLAILARDAGERAEPERLRRENTELRLDRAFLKKAAALFVSEHKR